MPNINTKLQKTTEYDPRWFIWTIVFLIVTGVALTTYVATSPDPVADVYAEVVNNRSIKK